MYTKILVGHDGSDRSREAVGKAVNLAEAMGAGLHLVKVVKTDAVEIVGDGLDYPTMAATEIALQTLEAEVPELTSPIDLSRVTVGTAVGDVAQGLADEAERIGADLIVVGNKNVQGIARILGSVASGVLRHAECAVLVEDTN